MDAVIPALTPERQLELRALWIRHAELLAATEPFAGRAPDLAEVEEEIDFLEMLVLTPTRAHPSAALLTQLGRPRPAPDPLRVLDFDPRARDARHEWIAFRDGSRAALRLLVWSPVHPADDLAATDLAAVARRGPADPRLAAAWRHELAVLATSQRVLGVRVTDRADWGLHPHAGSSRQPRNESRTAAQRAGSS